MPVLTCQRNSNAGEEGGDGKNSHLLAEKHVAVVSQWSYNNARLKVQSILVFMLRDHLK